jgi:hypothetical protein
LPETTPLILAFEPKTKFVAVVFVATTPTVAADSRLAELPEKMAE